MTNETAPTKSQTALKEEQLLTFWRDIDAFKKTLTQNAPKGEYVFFDGPPFATGTPHYGHLLASAIKDAIPRYKTMHGYRVLRRWGWDCHGLPIENIVEKDLGISGKKQIEEIGVEKFNEHARSKVLTFAGDWKKTVERFARWVEFENSYKTMDTTYIESVWWALKKLHEDKRIYESVKVLMYCPRCETPLSNAEVAMDNSYKDITDISVYVKFALKDEVNTFLLAWTTTPWTLPGNVALAVGSDIEYAKVKIADDGIGATYILAKERLAHSLKDKKYEIVGTIKGSDLVGKEYVPAFDYYSGKAHLKHKERAWKVYAGDFVTTTDGTGIVHIAPAFGEDDLSLARKHNLPIIHHIDKTGHFKPEVLEFAGQLAKPKDTKEEPVKHQSADIEIIKHLAHAGSLFAKEKIIHSYPHCYRCETPLFYYAIPAWFIEIQSAKEKLLSLNQKINWVPKHLKDGRFKHVMENAPDWNISRNRFWASPLPFWRSEETGEIEVLGSADDIRARTKSTNSYFVMRHGEGDHNVKGILSAKADVPHHLTEKGKVDALKAAELLKTKGITRIIVSPFVRTKETAELVNKVLGLSKDKITVDARLSEINTGDFDGKPIKTYHSHFSSFEERFTKPVPGGETLNDIRKRVGEFLYEIDARYKNETILFISHETVLWLLSAVASGFDVEKTIATRYSSDDEFINTAEVKEVNFAPIPHNANYELDFHRPYIDEITYPAPSGKGMMKRIPEVIDCWFESASMPFASQHYPFENRTFFKEHFPADFIAEYIAQTRTWFYYTHTISTLLFGDLAYKNVVTTGTVLAEDGQKMSKSKNNFPDPWIMFDKYGVDSVRFYLLSSPLLRSEDLNFSEREVDEIHKKIILRMKNVLSFLGMYATTEVKRNTLSAHVLDKWILKRLEEVRHDVTVNMDSYELDKALRTIPLFVDDLSTWYLRRSRDRMKNGGVEAEAALATLSYVLYTFSQIIAPFMPFLAEEIFQAVRVPFDKVSVHFTSWPRKHGSVISKVKNVFFSDAKILTEMAEVRDIVSLGLEARTTAGIKIKQPLSTLVVKDVKNLLSNSQYVDVIREELNVKNVVGEINRDTRVWLDTALTDELKEEGDYRELLRVIQDLRKKEGLSPKDRPTLVLHVGAGEKAFIEKFKEQLLRSASLLAIEYKETVGDETLINGKKFTLSIER